VQWSTELPQVVPFQTNPPGTAALDLSSVAERISKAGLQMTVETDCLAGHVGLEPANPSASYLIGIT
jgi:hypothetical protein